MVSHTVVSRYPANLASRQKHASDGMWRDNEVRLYTCFRLSLLSDINVSQGSVATLVRCDGIFNASFIANFLTSQAVQEL